MGIVLIVLVTLACIAGSIVGSDANMGVDYAQARVFHTPWFIGLMGLLLVNLVLCSWEKSYIALTLYKKRNTVANRPFFENATHSASIPWVGATDAVDRTLARRYTVTHRKGDAWYSQKGLLGRCGATIIHIGLLWTMAAGYYRILADDLGLGVFDSTVILPEGQSQQSFFQRRDRLKGSTADNLIERPMPFSLHLLDFRADYYPHSSVARYYSSLVELRDGSHTEIAEISMTHPLIYRGYKVTQNSFNENERVIRGRYRVSDSSTGQAVEVDAGAGDPVRLRLPGLEGVFFDVDSLEPGARDRVLDLGSRAVIQSGTVSSPRPTGMDMSQLEQQLKSSRYSILVAAMFPNFRLDKDNQPTTADDKFENPAVFVMVFKNGKPNGATWAFLNRGAQGIIGQPHPEVAVDFLEFRRAAGASGGNGLFDYEVRLRVRQKQPDADLGEYWLSAGALQELAGISGGILALPQVTNTAATPHGAVGLTDSLSSGTSETSPPAGGAGPQAAAAGGTLPQQTRFTVEYLGTAKGHVSFLGFMKDPSVIWIYIGSILIILGTLVAFLVTYREVWAFHDPETGRLYLATKVRGTSPAAHREFDRLVGELVELSAGRTG